jgi:hypothetical protein
VASLRVWGVTMPWASWMKRWLSGESLSLLGKQQKRKGMRGWLVQGLQAGRGVAGVGLELEYIVVQPARERSRRAWRSASVVTWLLPHSPPAVVSASYTTAYQRLSQRAASSIPPASPAADVPQKKQAGCARLRGK